MRDLPARHRSARAVFDQSWNLLTAEEREVMQTLSVFRGGFRGRAAQAVAGAPLALLADLVEKSMLGITPAGRYHMHELLRQYAAEQLQTSPQKLETAHNRHCEYYAAFLQGRGEELKGKGQQEALGELRAEIDNARAAWSWAVEATRVAHLVQALDGLCRFYEWQGRCQDGEAACKAAVEKLSPTSASVEELRTLVKTLTWQAAFSRALGRTERASQLLQESLGLLRRPELEGQDTRAEEAFAQLEMGQIAHILRTRAEARRWFERSLALYHSLGDESGMAGALERLGDTVWGSSDFGEAKRCYEQSLAIRQALGDRRGMADALLGLSGVTASSGQFEELAQSERLARRAVAIHREMVNRVGFARGVVHLASRLAVLGKFADACPLFEEAAGIYDDLGLRLDFAVAQDLLGWMKTNLGSYDEARALCETALAAFQEVEDHHGVGMSCLGLGEIVSAQGGLVEARQRLEESVAIFREVGQREHEALALIALARVSIGLGQRDRAHEDLRRALQIAIHVRAFAPSIFAIAISALLFLNRDEVERAVELCALASRYPYFGSSRFWEDVAGKHIAAATAALPSEMVAAAQERGRARDLWGTAEELLDELNA
jgi:tetratricopeptide (TPR) repeat protein